MATQFFDVDGIPVSLGMVPSVPYCAAWDSVPPRVFDPESARRNGSPIDLAEFKSLLSAEALAFANSQAGLTAPAMKPLQVEAEKRVAAAIEKFNKDNKGKTWEDLAREQEKHLGKPSV